MAGAQSPHALLRRRLVDDLPRAHAFGKAHERSLVPDHPPDLYGRHAGAARQAPPLHPRSLPEHGHRPQCRSLERTRAEVPRLADRRAGAQGPARAGSVHRRGVPGDPRALDGSGAQRGHTFLGVPHVHPDGPVPTSQPRTWHRERRPRRMRDHSGCRRSACTDLGEAGCPADRRAADPTRGQPPRGQGDASDVRRPSRRKALPLPPGNSTPLE